MCAKAIEEIMFEKIKSSKKYGLLCEDIIRRIISEEVVKYKKIKDAENSVKTKLHISYGAFFKAKCHETALRMYEEGRNLEDILRLHVSTEERLPFLKEFYDYIFTLAKGDSIIDLGCGFNPLTYHYQGDISKYYAYDLDFRTKNLINAYFEAEKIDGKAEVVDLLSKVPDEKADITYLFKLLPLLEAQKKGRAVDILNALQTKYCIITYPLKSISGKEKNMGDSYSKQFESIIARTDLEVIGENKIENELIYVTKRK